VLSADADPEAVLATLDAALAEIAARERAWLIVWKEFDATAAARLAPLLARGYHRAESPVMHELDVRFKDFPDYCAALKSHYRSDVRRSERKFRASGFRVAQMHAAEEIRRVYTPEVHRLYEAVVAKSPVKLEVLPIEFFRELVRQIPRLRDPDRDLRRRPRRRVQLGDDGRPRPPLPLLRDGLRGRPRRRSLFSTSCTTSWTTPCAAAPTGSRWARPPTPSRRASAADRRLGTST